MTAKELLYIKIIIDEKSVSKAAKRLFVAQPALSQIIKRIENMYEIKLFNRVGNKIIPTEDGKKYYNMAVKILNIVDNFLVEINDDNRLHKGKIRLGITNFLGTSLLPEVLPQFHDTYPKVEIFIIETNSNELEKGLLSGELDLVVMHALDENINRKINYDIVSRDDFVVLANKKHPLNEFGKKVKNSKYPELDLKLLLNESFIMVHKEQRIRQATDAILKKANIINPKILYTIKNFSTVQRLIANGLGVTLMPNRYLTILGNDNNLSCFSINKKYNAYWDLCIATNKNMPITLTAETFIEMMKEYL
ncbi:LysR family transcriptional regulator [Fusobacterium sp. PH5-44]|uniref:LysR family transcriptional regulator n=1 Tax=unclassified Fusobacterium TaxID=2648384 RepID=UPI003D22D355